MSGSIFSKASKSGPIQSQILLKFFVRKQDLRWIDVIFSCALVLLSGCATQIDGPFANARLTPTKGNTTTGLVTFKTIGSKVLVTAEIQGLKPNAEHGFHVHEKGDCSSGDGMVRVVTLILAVRRMALTAVALITQGIYPL